MMELKYMMEKLGHPQTHVALKEMIKEIDEDQDEKISFREFLLIFRKAARGELSSGGNRSIIQIFHLFTSLGLSQLASTTNVDVQKEGVGGAKNFFDAKVFVKM